MTNKEFDTRIESYGLIAVELLAFAKKISTNQGNRDKWSESVRQLYNFAQKTDGSIAIVQSLTVDPQRDIRDFAGLLIRYLWQYWKTITYDSKLRMQFNNEARAHTQSLIWTIPIIKSLLKDRATAPVCSALYVIWELDNIPQRTKNQIRVLALKLTRHNSAAVKVALTRTLYYLYPINLQARYILDDNALKFLVDCTYDAVEKVRDAACFVLWLDVENLNNTVAQAFLDAIDRESPYSEVYVEAVTGAARMGVDCARVDSIIHQQLENSYFGVGWIDAAELSHREMALTDLLLAYQSVLKENTEDNRLNLIEEVLLYWND